MSISCDLVKTILSKLNKSYTGTSLARIDVEVGEEEDQAELKIKWLFIQRTLGKEIEALLGQYQQIFGITFV